MTDWKPVTQGELGEADDPRRPFEECGSDLLRRAGQVDQVAGRREDNDNEYSQAIDSRIIGVLTQIATDAHRC